MAVVSFQTGAQWLDSVPCSISIWEGAATPNHLSAARRSPPRDDSSPLDSSLCAHHPPSTPAIKDHFCTFLHGPFHSLH